MEKTSMMLLFDLDGTLTCSHPGILLCVQRALEEMGKPLPPQEEMRRFVGPPLGDSFRLLAGLSETECEEAVRRYRVHYEKEGALMNAPYEGIIPMLHRLRQEGLCLGVATSKPSRFTGRILDHFALTDLFDGVFCGDEDLHPLTKGQIIEKAMEAMGTMPSQTLMVGDTLFDARGAREACVPFVGVLYGYGTRAEMEQEGATVFARSVAELQDALLEMAK